MLLCSDAGTVIFPQVIMLLPGYHISRPFIFLTVFVTAIIASPQPSDDKTFNLKIGFDLSHGENGAPALRIRDFEDSKDFNPRAVEDAIDKNNDGFKKDEEEDVKGKDNHKESPLRKGSDSSSGDSDQKGDDVAKASDSSAESKSKSKEADAGRQGEEPAAGVAAAHGAAAEKDSDDESGDSEADAKRSTRGLIVADRNENEDRRRKRSAEIRRRHKRAAENFIKYYNENIKRKHKKVHGIPLIPRSTSYKPY